MHYLQLCISSWEPRQAQISQGSNASCSAKKIHRLIWHVSGGTPHQQVPLTQKAGMVSRLESRKRGVAI